jgi:DNA-directed RNA polymerase subunit delta
MSSQYTLKVPAEKAKEMPMVDLAFELLKAANIPFYYRDLMLEIAKIKGLSDDQMMNVIAQLYTEINIDGRFACVGANLWGLKRWYPVEKSDEAVAGSSKRPRIINDEDDDLDDEVYPEEEETYDAEEFEDFDSEQDEFATEEVEENDFYEEEEIEEEEIEEAAIDENAEALVDDLDDSDDDEESEDDESEEVK